MKEFNSLKSLWFEKQKPFPLKSCLQGEENFIKFFQNRINKPHEFNECECMSISTNVNAICVK